MLIQQCPPKMCQWIESGHGILFKSIYKIVCFNLINAHFLISKRPKYPTIKLEFRSSKMVLSEMGGMSSQPIYSHSECQHSSAPGTMCRYWQRHPAWFCDKMYGYECSFTNWNLLNFFVIITSDCNIFLWFLFVMYRCIPWPILFLSFLQNLH